MSNYNQNPSKYDDFQRLYWERKSKMPEKERNLMEDLHGEYPTFSEAKLFKLYNMCAKDEARLREKIEQILDRRGPEEPRNVRRADEDDDIENEINSYLGKGRPQRNQQHRQPDRDYKNNRRQQQPMFVAKQEPAKETTKDVISKLSDFTLTPQQEKKVAVEPPKEIYAEDLEKTMLKEVRAKEQQPQKPQHHDTQHQHQHQHQHQTQPQQQQPQQQQQQQQPAVQHPQHSQQPLSANIPAAQPASWITWQVTFPNQFSTFPQHIPFTAAYIDQLHRDLHQLLAITTVRPADHVHPPHPPPMMQTSPPVFTPPPPPPTFQYQHYPQHNGHHQ